LCLQADVFFSGTDDDVVKKLDTDDASDLDEPFGHLDIFPRWMRVTARMLMADDERRRIVEDGGLKDFSRMDDTRVDATDVCPMDGNDAVLRIE